MRSYTLGELCSAAFASAGVFFYLGTMAAHSAQAAPATPARQPEIVVYTCDNLHHAPANTPPTTPPATRCNVCTMPAKHKAKPLP